VSEPRAPVVVRSATEGDAEGVLAIARELVRDGTTYVFAPETTDDELRAYFLDPRATRLVATVAGEVAGCYLLRINRAGRGSHVANASYAVAERFAGRGVGRALGEHSLEEARRQGFTAMQFNFVVSTNEAAIALWKKLGFRIVGELPKAFRHPTRGLVDAYVMHRFL
jgi:ribosomal protein S18 acetylase RimI-like enzyme